MFEAVSSLRLAVPCFVLSQGASRHKIQVAVLIYVAASDLSDLLQMFEAVLCTLPAGHAVSQ